MNFTPHAYQQYAIDRVVNDPAVGLLLDMGLGKTAIMLSAINRLMYEHCEVGRVLVIAPKKVAEATWQTEAAKWDELKHLRISTVLGTEKERVAALQTPADIYIINRENIPWLVLHYRVNGKYTTWPFDMVVVDESSSFKNPTAKRFKALKAVLPRIARTVILTGTPAPNGVEDLWAQVYLLDKGERLGRYVTHFRDKYFDYNPWRHERTPKDGAFEAIQEKVSDICISMSASDYLQLPDMVVDDIPVKLDRQAEKAYTEMEKTMLLSVDDDTEITALGAAALTGKLLQLCSGSVYDDDGTAHKIHDCKLESFAELVESLGVETALCFYGYKHEVPRLVEKAEKLGKKVRILDSAKDAEDWNAGKVDLLLAHPASCAYGLNLQAGGHHVIWYTLNWSLELYQQANARLHRQGQQKPVIVHRLLVQGGVDEDVAEALSGKADTQDSLIHALKARIKKARQ